LTATPKKKAAPPPSPLDAHLASLDITALRADGYDDCVIGHTSVVVEGVTHERLVYNVDLIIEKLTDGIMSEGVDEEEAREMALEHFDYNMACAYVGPNTPIFMYPIPNLTVLK
jgi:hypothetical protein